MMKVCLNCETIYPVKPSHYDISSYCSKSCMAEDYKTRLRGDNNPNYRGAGIIICANCGKEFQSYYKNTYCSLDCYTTSDQKRIDARRANDGNRKLPGKCKVCGLEIPYTRNLCDEHKPKPKTPGHCQNCGGLSGSDRDIQYCKTCRSKGLHKKEVFSICSACGEKIPDKYGRKYCDLCLDRFYKSKRTTPRRVDANQGEIVKALLSVGCSIVDTSDVGGGFPDLIVGRNRKNYLIEIKNPEAKGKLNELQEKFIAKWPAPIHIVHSIEEALDVVMEGAEDEQS